MVKFHEEMKILEFLIKMVIFSTKLSAPSLYELLGTYRGSDFVTKSAKIRLSAG